MRKIKGLKPIINSKTELLILGSIPGNLSLVKKQYYAYERNFFWRIIFKTLKTTDPLSYNDRIKILLKNKIGIWNVLKICRREGSCDHKIKEPKINNFSEIFSKHKNIKIVCLNGKTAFNIFHKHFHAKTPTLHYEYLPSTSTRNTAGFKYIANKWNRKLNKFVNLKNEE